MLDSTHRFALAMVLVASSSYAQPTLDELLSLPLSPGALALLASDATEPRASARLAAALGNEAPTIRAAAARVVFTGGVSALLPDAELALASEVDKATGAELVRIVASFGGSEKAELVLDAAERLEIVSTAGDALASSQAHGALAHVDRLRAAETNLPLAAFLTAASARFPGALVPLAVRAMREADGEFWAAYLETLRSRETLGDTGMIVFGISSRDDELRLETLWHLVSVMASGIEIPGPLGPFLDEALEVGSRSEDPWEAFALELIRRQWTEAVTEDAQWLTLLRSESERLFPFLTNAHLLLLTRNERRTLGESRYEDPQELDALHQRLESVRKLPEAPRQELETTKRSPVMTIASFPPGFVSSLIKVTGCEPSKNGATAAEIQIVPDGRRRSTTFLVPPGFEMDDCDRLGRALILTNVSRLRRDGTRPSTQTLVALQTAPFLSCVEAPAPRENLLQPAGHGMKAPEKKRDQSPFYPEGARRDRVQGVVVMDAIITSTGCVREITTLRSPDPRLTLASLLAVSQWEYEPMLRAGKPTPIVMTVTVNFALR